MNKTPRTDYYWRKINQDNIDGYGLALRMRDHAYKLEEKMTDLMEWRIEIENTLHNVAEEREEAKKFLDLAHERSQEASEWMRKFLDVRAQNDHLSKSITHIVRLMRSEADGARSMVSRYDQELDEYASAVHDRADACEGYAEMLEKLLEKEAIKEHDYIKV